MIYKLNNGGVVKLQNAWTTMPSVEDTILRTWANQRAKEKAEKQVASEKPKYTYVNPYDYLHGWREATEDAAKQDKYTVENLGGSKEEAEAAYNASKENAAKQLAGTTATGLGTVALLGLSGGAAGPVAADIVNTGFGAHGLYNALSGNGIQKTVRLANQGDTWGTIKSGAGDLIDLSMGLHAAKLWGNLGKSMLAGQSLGNAYRGNVAGRELSNGVRRLTIPVSDLQRNIEAGKIGWAPATTKTLWHNSNDPVSELKVNFPAWDVVKRDAPLGHVWLTGNETTQGFLAKRPHHLKGKVKLNKPMVQVGEAIGDGKNVTRNQILDFAQKSSADGINFQNIADNTLQNQDVYAVFKDTNVEPKLHIREKLGLSKGRYGSLNRFQKEALDDLEYFNNTDNYRFYWDGEKFIYSKPSDLQSGFRKLLEFDSTPKYYNFNTPFGNLKWEPDITRPKYFGTSALPSTAFGEADLYGSKRYGKIILTSPYTDAKINGLENAEDFSKTLPKDVIKRFWINADQIVPKGTYVSGDEGALPLGAQLKSDWDAMHSSGIKHFNDGTTQRVKSGSIDDLLRHLFQKYPYKTGREGLSVDSYMAILKQGNRPEHKLRFSPDGFSIFNGQGVENKWLYDLHQQMLEGKIPQQQFIDAFNKWVEPYNGMKAVIKNGEVIIPQPFIRYKQGGILKAQSGTGLAGIPILGNLAKKGFELVAKRSNGAQTKSIPTIIGDIITGRDKSFYNINNSNGSNEIDTYLYGKPYNSEFTGNASIGPDYTNYINKNYPNKNIKTYNTHFGDTLYIDNKAKSLVEKQLNTGEVVGGSMGRYAHAPSYIVTTEEGRPYDAGGHLIKFSKDKNGNIVANMSDIYDFLPEDFNDKYDQTENPSWTRNFANNIGTPFIVRQNNIPVVFKEIVPEYKTEKQKELGDFLSQWGNTYDLKLPLKLSDEQIDEIFDGRDYGDDILDFMISKGYIKPVYKQGGILKSQK